MPDSFGSSNSFAKSLWTTKGKKGDLIPLLQSAQDAYGYVPEAAMESIAGLTGIPVSEIYGVVTFYTQFRLTPRGEYVIKICNGTACHVNNSSMLESTIEDVLGIKRGETDKELLFTMESVNCVGCCSLAPVVMVNDDTYGSLTPRKMTALLKRLRKDVAGAKA
jgi:NADH-quinone oxidoreductase subunit E